MYQNLCLSGGGIKLISFIGTLKYIFHNKYMNYKNIKKFIGVSAGSIICFLLNIGYTIDELEEFSLNFTFSKLLPKVNSENLLFLYGFNKNTQMKRLFSLLLKNKYDINDITFKQLFTKTNKHLQIGISNITDNKFELWDHINNPNTSVITAVALSCNVPIVFQPTKINNKLYLDGGLLNNFPVNFIPNSQFKNTIAIASDSKYPDNFNNVFEYLGKVIFIIASNNDKIRIDNYKNKLDIIVINSQDNLLNFSIDKNTIIKRIKYGYDVTKQFFYKKNINKKITRRNSI